MKKHKRPTGFVAICFHCKKTVAAMDFIRTDKEDAGKIISEWLMRGCIVEPRFDSPWSEKLESCECE